MQLKSSIEVALIAAFCVKTRAIGKNGRIPWLIKEDLEYFKGLTTGSAVIFGRKTFESIGSALPGRTNIILSRNNDFSAENAAVVPSLEKAIEEAERSGCRKAFICGGGKVYEEGLSLAETIYTTEVEGCYEGDAFFPQIDPSVFEEISRISRSNESHSWDFVIYQRKKSLLPGRPLHHPAET